MTVCSPSTPSFRSCSKKFNRWIKSSKGTSQPPEDRQLLEKYRRVVRIRLNLHLCRLRSRKKNTKEKQIKNMSASLNRQQRRQRRQQRCSLDTRRICSRCTSNRRLIVTKPCLVLALAMAAAVDITTCHRFKTQFPTHAVQTTH